MKNILLLTTLFLSSMAAYSQAYWHTVPSGTSKGLLSISFGTATTGYIGGRDSLLLKTTNGGQSWQAVPLTGITFAASVNGVADDITSVDFVSANVGYITVSEYENPIYSGAVYKTTNGGTSWTLADAGNTAAFRTYFFAEGDGYVIGSAFFAGYVISKIAGGNPAAYHYLSTGPTDYFRAVDFRNSQTGIVAGDHGLVSRTFDAGVTWDTVQTLTDSTIYAIRFLDDSTILAASNNMGASLLISTDTGRTWNVEMNSLTFDYPVMRALTFSAKDSFIAAGSSGTFDGKGTLYGHDHTFNRSETVDHPLYGIAMQNDSIAYAVGDNGLIVTNRTSVLAIPDVTGLEDNGKLYPNPGSGNFTTVLSRKHTLKVYDLSGKMILSRKQPALQQWFNLSGYAAGTYLVEIQAKDQKSIRKLSLK